LLGKVSEKVLDVVTHPWLDTDMNHTTYSTATATERAYEARRQENMLDQRIRIAVARRCSGACVLPDGHDGQHMRQDGSRHDPR
jgi:hypothetical protein